MNHEGTPTPSQPVLTSTEDLLAKLAKRQGVMIGQLGARIKVLEDANETLSTDLLAASEARAEALVELQRKVEVAGRAAALVFKQRDAVVDALRMLCRHLENQPITSLTYFGGEQFARDVRCVKELLKVIDQMREHAGGDRVRGEDGECSGVTPGKSDSPPVS